MDREAWHAAVRGSQRSLNNSMSEQHLLLCVGFREDGCDPTASCNHPLGGAESYIHSKYHFQSVHQADFNFNPMNILTKVSPYKNKDIHKDILPAWRCGQEAALDLLGGSPPGTPGPSGVVISGPAGLVEELCMGAEGAGLMERAGQGGVDLRGPAGPHRQREAAHDFPLQGPSGCHPGPLWLTLAGFIISKGPGTLRVSLTADQLSQGLSTFAGPFDHAPLGQDRVSASWVCTIAARARIQVWGGNVYLVTSPAEPAASAEGLLAGGSEGEHRLAPSLGFKAAAYAVGTHAGVILFLAGLDSWTSWLCRGDKGLFSVGSSPRGHAGMPGWGWSSCAPYSPEAAGSSQRLTDFIYFLNDCFPARSLSDLFLMMH